MLTCDPTKLVTLLDAGAITAYHKADDPILNAVLLATCKASIEGEAETDVLSALSTDAAACGQAILEEMEGTLPPVLIPLGWQSVISATAKACAKQYKDDGEISAELNVTGAGSSKVLHFRILVNRMPTTAALDVPLLDERAFPLPTVQADLRGAAQKVVTVGEGDAARELPAGALQSFGQSTLKAMVKATSVFSGEVSVYTPAHPASKIIVTADCMGEGPYWRAVFGGHQYSPDADVFEPPIPAVEVIARGTQWGSEATEKEPAAGVGSDASDSSDDVHDSDLDEADDRSTDGLGEHYGGMPEDDDEDMDVESLPSVGNAV